MIRAARNYADSSFILRLVTGETNSPQVVAEYRRLGRPKLLYLSLHDLEVRNAILQRAFFERRTLPARERQDVARKRDESLARLEQLIGRKSLLQSSVDFELATAKARALSRAHTERTGARSIDLLHVAYAVTLESELFRTTDHRQSIIAKAEGLKVVYVSSANGTIG